MTQTLKLLTTAFALLLFWTSAGNAGEPGNGPPLKADSGQELAHTMRWLKNAVESISITLNPVDPEDGDQYYSQYSFSNEGCSVRFSYDFNYYQRKTHARKTSRIVASFHLKDINSLEVAPFILTHIETHLYSINGKRFRIPIKDAGLAEQIVKELNHARRLCGATDE